MNLNIVAYYVEAINYFQLNIYIATALAGVLFLFLFQKPELFFTLVFIVAMKIALFYIISHNSSVWSKPKE